MDAERRPVVSEDLAEKPEAVVEPGRGSPLADTIGREAFGVVLGLFVVCLVFVPRNAVAAYELGALLLMPTALLAASWPKRVQVSRTTASVVTAALVSSGFLVARAALADSPRISLFGNRGQHSGALMWFALAALLAVLVTTDQRGRLLSVARAIAVAAAALAAAAFAEFAGLISWNRLADTASGLFENSISLAQVLILGMGAGLLWLFTSRSAGIKSAAAACIALCAGGLIVSQTRAAWLGAAIALAIVGVGWVFARAGRFCSRDATHALLGLLAAGTAATWWLGSLAYDDAMVTRAEAVLSGRIAIWASAVAKIVRGLAFGYGPEQFSSLVQWSARPDGSFAFVATYDPHNVVFYWLLAGGIPGAFLGGWAVYRIVRVYAEALVGSRFNRGFVALAWALVAWFAMLLFSWTNVTAATMAVALVGSLISEWDAAGRARGATIAEKTFLSESPLVAIVAAATLFSALLGIQTLSAETVWASRLQGGTLSPETLVAAGESSHDPVYAADAATMLMSGEFGTDDIGAVWPLVTSAQRWHVDAAITSTKLSLAQASADDYSAAWLQSRSAIDAGKVADPRAGMWDYIGAMQADVLGLDNDAAAFATSALRYDLDSVALERMLSLIE